MQDYREFLQEVLVDAEGIQRRVAELGAEISRDYASKELVLICILRGGVVFLTDLMRQINIPHRLDFMSVASYDDRFESNGRPRIILDVSMNVSQKHVLLVEDIVDSGHTIRAVVDLLHTRQPASVKVCTLLDKPERRAVEVPVDYVGFAIPNKFVFGYGLDIWEYYRNLPFVGVVDLARLEDPKKDK